jgi:hypothetical protein
MEDAVPVYPEEHETVRVEPYVDAPAAMVYPVCVGEEGQLTIVQPEDEDHARFDPQVMDDAVPV